MTLISVLTAMSVINGLIGLWAFSIISYNLLGERQTATAELVAGMMERGVVSPDELRNLSGKPETNMGGKKAASIYFVSREKHWSAEKPPSEIRRLIEEKLRYYTETNDIAPQSLGIRHTKLKFVRQLRFMGVAPVFGNDGRIEGIVAAIPHFLETGRLSKNGIIADSDRRRIFRENSLVVRTLLTDVFEKVIVSIGLAVLFLSIMAGIRLFSKLNRNLTEFQRAAKNFGSGDLSARIHIPEGDYWGHEMTQLSATFNEMAERISEDAERRKQLFAEISHELGTPLTTLETYLETLLMEDLQLDSETQKAYLEVAQGEAKRIERLVFDIIDLSKMDADEIELDLSPMDLMSTVYKAVNAFTLEKPENIEIIVVDPPDRQRPMVFGDPLRLHQVLQNIIGNGIKAMPQGGRLSLEIDTKTPEVVTVCVSDTGIGIDREELPFIFDRFYRGTGTKKLGAGGRGLGLAITKRLIELHGGKIWAESERGVGTRICFSLREPKDLIGQVFGSSIG